MSEDTETKALSNVVRIDEEQIRDHLGKIVRGSKRRNPGPFSRPIRREDFKEVRRS